MEYLLKKILVPHLYSFNSYNPYSTYPKFEVSYCINSNLIPATILAIKRNYEIKYASSKGGYMIDYYQLETSVSLFQNKVVEHDRINNLLSVVIQPFNKPSLMFDGKSLKLFEGTGNRLIMNIPALSGIKGVSGKYIYDPIPNGVYKVNRPYQRNDVSGMIREGYGFSMDVIPIFSEINNMAMRRTELRIHPDGNRPGSAGCIALSTDKANLQNFYLRIKIYLKKYKYIDLTVNDYLNPNVLHNRNLKKRINE